MKHPGSYNPSAARGISTDTPNASEFLRYVHDKQAPRLAPRHHEGFLAADPKMLRIKEIVDQIADANVPVLISGESGTGKEVIAQAIHRKSQRNAAPFVAINCAALPPALLESELFGFERGSFTGAHQRHVGKFEQANGGTLLLDEVTEMDPSLQVKLLRALQEKEVERIGGSGPISVDVRIIATTNRDILKQVAQGSFRQDLYYRLYVIHLEVPPLRERPGDIAMLAQHFLQDFRQRFSKPKLEIGPDVMDRLLAYPWPGNVRELQNVIQRAVVMANSDFITLNETPIKERKTIEARDWQELLPIGRTLNDLETAFILRTLEHHRGNRTHAAKTLGISLRTLRNKINEFTAEGINVVRPGIGRE